MFATIALGALAAVLAVLLYRRSRELGSVQDVAERLEAVALTGDLTERLTPHASEGRAVEMAASIDKLIERVQGDTSALAEREQVYRRLLETMHEAMAVERDGIVLANARFAELSGFEGPAQLASYTPTGTEKWIRIEADSADGHTAWSQPFWMLPR